MRRYPLAVVAGLGALAACNLITGAGDLATAPGGDGGLAFVDGSPDAAAEASAGDGAARDVEVAEAGCPSVDAVANTTGALTARRATAAITVDGRLDDWACAPFTRLDRSSAAKVTIIDAGTADAFAMDFAVMWEPSAIYVAARASNAQVPGGIADAGVFKNDGIEVYLDADGVLAGYAMPGDHHYVVDHQNRAEDFVVGVPLGAATIPPAGAFTSSVTRTGGGISFEMRIDKSAFLSMGLVAGAKLGFDLAANDGDGVKQRTQLIWYLAPGCVPDARSCCGQAVDEPYCNTQRYGTLTLLP